MHYFKLASLLSCQSPSKSLHCLAYLASQLELIIITLLIETQQTHSSDHVSSFYHFQVCLFFTLVTLRVCGSREGLLLVVTLYGVKAIGVDVRRKTNKKQIWHCILDSRLFSVDGFHLEGFLLL